MKENSMIVVFFFLAFTFAELLASSSVIVAGVAKLKNMLTIQTNGVLRSNQTLLAALNGAYGAAVARDAKIALDAYKFSAETTAKTTLGLACTDHASSETTVDVLEAVASSASGSGVIYLDKNCDGAFTSDVDQASVSGQLTNEIVASQNFVQVTMKTSDTQLAAALVPVSMALAGSSSAPPLDIPFPFSRALAPIFIAPVALSANTFEGESINHAIYDDEQTIVKEVDFDCQIAQTTTLDARFARTSADDGKGGLCSLSFPDTFPAAYFRGRLWFDNNNDGFMQPHERRVGPDDLDNAITLAFAVTRNNEFVVVKTIDFAGDGIYEAVLTETEIKDVSDVSRISLIVLAAVPRANRDGKYVPLPTLCGNTNPAGFVSSRSPDNTQQFPYLASTADFPNTLAQDTSQTVIAEITIANIERAVYARTARINFGFACRATVEEAPATEISLQVEQCDVEQLDATTAQITDTFRLQISAAAAGAWRNARIMVASANRSNTDGTLGDTETFAGFSRGITIVANDGTEIFVKSQPFAAATKRILMTSDITQQQPSTRTTDLVLTVTVTSQPSQNGCFGVGGKALVNEVVLSLLSVPFEQFHIGQFGASCVHKQSTICIDTDGQGPTTTPTPTTAASTSGTIAFIAIFLLVVLAICCLCLVTSN